jgi:hypothetical protein
MLMGFTSTFYGQGQFSHRAAGIAALLRKRKK